MKTKLIALSSLVFLLSACGGGGGGSDAPPAPAFTLSTGSLNFTTSSPTLTPASQLVIGTVTGVQVSTLFIRVVVTGPAIQTVSNFSITSGTSGQASVFPASASTLGPGVYNSTITVTACTSDPNCSTGVIGSPQNINVTYTINGATLSSVAAFSVGDAAVSNLARQATLSLYPAQNWTTAINAPWVTVSPASASAAMSSQLTISLVQSQIDVMNDGTYNASLVITPASASAITVPLSMTISRTQGNVGPYVALANTSDEIIVRGSFGNRTITGVRFGSVDAVSFRTINASEIRATHPALTPGRYTVQVLDNAQFSRTLPELVVVALPVYAANTVGHGDNTVRQINDVLFDSERGALLVAMGYPSIGAATSEVIRYVLSNGNWVINTRRTIFNVASLALSSDGRTLLAGVDGSQSASSITHLDPTTLAVIRTDNAAIISGGKLAVTNDGHVIYASSGGVIRYSIATGVGSSVSALSTYGSPRASLDGSIVILGGLSQPLWYSTNGATVTQIPNNISPHTVSLSRDGTRYVLLDPAVARAYNGTHSQLGTLPSTIFTAIVNPVGQRAYAIDSLNSQLRTLDLSGIPGAAALPEIGSGITLPAPLGGTARLAITPDGRTLFVVGSSNIFVVPVQ